MVLASTQPEGRRREASIRNNLGLSLRALAQQTLLEGRMHVVDAGARAAACAERLAAARRKP